MAKNGPDPRDNESYWNPSKQNSKESKKNGVDLNDAEKKATKTAKEMLDSESSDKKSNFKYSPNTSLDPRAKTARLLARTFGGKKKYGWFGGALIATFVVIIFIAAPLFGPLQMFENLEDFHLGPRRDTISARTVRVIKKIRADTNRTDPVSKRLAEIDVDNLQEEFSAKGYSLELDANGTPTGIVDTDGNLRSLDNIDEVADLLDDAVPASKATSRGYMRNLFTATTGYSWSSILGRADPDSSVWDWLRTRARLSDTDVDLSSRRALDDPNTDPDVLRELANLDDLSGPTGDAVRAAETALQDGADPPRAIDAGAKVFAEKIGISGKSAAMATLLMACTSKAVYDNEIQLKWNNFRSAVSSFFDLAIIADEIKTGNVNNAEHIGQYMHQYSNSTGSFAGSAGWQETTGQEITGPGLRPENNVNASVTSDDFLGSVLGGVGNVGGVVDSVPALSQFCGLFNSAISTVVGGIVASVLDWGSAAVELAGACTAGAALSFGGTCALKVGSVAAFEVGLPRLFSVILSAFVEKAIDSPEEAFNFLAHAGALVNSESSRTGRPVDNETYVANDLNPYLEKKAEENTSLYAKYLSPGNPKSLLSQVGVWKTNLAASEMGLVDGLIYIAKAPFSLASSLLHSVGFNNAHAVAESESIPSDSIQKFSYRTESLSSDPVELANEVTLMLDSDPELQKTAEYCMGYSHANDVIDLSLQLPLYSNPGEDDSGFFAALGFGDPDAEQKNALVQTYCIPNSSGTLDSGVSLDDYEKLGRFVDDLIIAESVLTYVSPGEIYSGNQSTSSGGGGSSSSGGDTPVVCETDSDGNLIVDPGGRPCAL